MQLLCLFYLLSRLLFGLENRMELFLYVPYCLMLPKHVEWEADWLNIRADFGHLCYSEVLRNITVALCAMSCTAANLQVQILPGK